MTSTDSSVSQAARMYVRVRRDCRVYVRVAPRAWKCRKTASVLARARSNESTPTRFFKPPPFLSFHLSPVIPRVCVTLRFGNYSGRFSDRFTASSWRRLNSINVDFRTNTKKVWFNDRFVIRNRICYFTRVVKNLEAESLSSCKMVWLFFKN